MIQFIDGHVSLKYKCNNFKDKNHAERCYNERENASVMSLLREAVEI